MYVKWKQQEQQQLNSQIEQNGGKNHVKLGPMRVKQQKLSVMLVFAREEAQCDALWWATRRGGYTCNIARNSESALECYLEHHHDLIIIDARSPQFFDHEALCRSIRATKESDYTVIVAVTKNYGTGAEEPSVLPLLKAGFNRRITENSSETAWLNELQILEQTDVRMQVRLRASQALLTAVESSADPIEITSEDFEIQYVNPAYERLLGYTSDELIGTDIRILTKSEKNKHDVSDTINSQLKKGKVWEGTCCAKRKGGDTVTHHCHTSPVVGQNGKIRHIVTIRNPTYEGHDRMNGDVVHMNGGTSGLLKKRESFAKIHSISIEAPITKVINIINAAQEISPTTVAQALDRVLDILRQTDQDFYSPSGLANHMPEDQMTHDFVEGLMTQTNFSGKMRESFTKSHQGQLQGPASLSLSTASILTTAAPEITTILATEQDWNFDVIQLEKLTNHRPLVYLALKTFQKFGVMEFLHVSDQIMCNWLQMIESKYLSANSYHTSTHAADVMQATAYFLQKDKLRNVMDDVDVVAALIAAVIHDVDHPGRTNPFLVNSNSHLAIVYNDLAVLESHHASLTFQLTLKDERVNIFKNLDREDYRMVRQQIVDMVLATDMTKHFEHSNKFISSINSYTHKEDDASMSGRDSPVSMCSTARLTSPENKSIIKRMLIKCADISNPLRPLNLSIEWAKRISEEYFSQTDEEKAKGMPVMMVGFDRATCNMPTSQIRFIDLFINDMFEAWNTFCGLNEPMEHLSKNYKYWKSQEPIDAERTKSAQTKPEDSTPGQKS